MTGQTLPPVSEVLPQRGRMMLLSAVLEHAASDTVCAIEVGPDSPFLEADGAVAPWIALEYMAQCVAAHAGLDARAKGEPPKVGFLIGSRRLEFRTKGFRVGQRLTVRATRTWGENEFALFTCRLIDTESQAILVEGNLNVFLPHSIERFLPREQR